MGHGPESMQGHNVGDHWVFVGLLALLVWASLPLGSNRTIGSFLYHNSLAAYLCMCLSIGIGLMLARLGNHKARYTDWRARVVAAIAFILSAKMRLRLMLVVMVIALVLTRSRMGNAAFFTAMVVGLMAIVLVRKTAPQTILLITSWVIVEIATDYGLLGLGALGLLVGLTLATVVRVLAKRKSSLPWGMAFGVGMAMVALLVHSTMDLNLQIPANALTIVVILAMGWIAHTLPSPGARRQTVKE